MMRGAFEREVRDAFATVFLSQQDEAVDDSPIWTALPGPQTQALESEADELFFGGAGGGGKTDLVLGAAITKHKSSVIFRTEFAQFRGPEGAIERSKEIIGSRGRLNESTFQWRGLPGGRSFEFAGVKLEKDVSKWKGRPHDLKAFDEIPDFKEAYYRFLIGWLRTSVIGQRTRVICTGNPPTSAEGQWVVRYWAPWLDKQHPNPAKPGELRWFAMLDGKDVEVPNGNPIRDAKGEEIRPRSRTFIPARVEDNPYYMRTGYIDVLNSLPEPLRSQLRFGDFGATQDDNPWQVIPTAWIVAAQHRWRQQPRPPADVPLTSLGVDPSRGGIDKFTLAKRYDNWVDQVERHDGKEAPDGQAGARIIQKLLQEELEGEQLRRTDKRAPWPDVMDVTVNVDVIGSAGSSVFDQARDLGLQAVGLNGSERTDAVDKSGRLRFFNKRAWWHWYVRECLAPDSGMDMAIPPDPEVLADLSAPRWRITPRGVQVEPKEDIKERIGRSPDAGEAVIYAMVEDGGAGLGFLQFAGEQVKGERARARARADAAADEKADEADDTNPWLED